MNVGLDLGYSAVKLVADGRRRAFPSVVGTPEVGRFSLDQQENHIVLTRPERVLVREGAMTQSRFVNRREDRAWIESAEYYHLFLTALTELSTATVVDLLLVTGLPVGFYSDKATLRDRLVGVHKAAREGRPAQNFKVSECRIIPQPFGALRADNRRQLERLLDLYLSSEFSKEVLIDRRQRLESTIEALDKERNNLLAHLEARTLTVDQIQSIQDFAVKLQRGFAAADTDDQFETRRQIMAEMDVQVILTIEDNERIAYASCILGEEVLHPVSSNTAIPAPGRRSSCRPTPPSPRFTSGSTPSLKRPPPREGKA